MLLLLTVVGQPLAQRVVRDAHWRGHHHRRAGAILEDPFFFHLGALVEGARPRRTPLISSHVSRPVPSALPRRTLSKAQTNFVRDQ